MVTSSAQRALLVGCGGVERVAVLVGDALGRHAEVVRGDGDELVLELLRRMEGRAAEHDRHAAADRAVARQRIERVRRAPRAPCRDRRSSTSPTTVPTSVSWPCPAEVVCMVAVIEPTRSTLMRQESIQVVVPTLGLSSGSNEELPPLGSRHAAMPMPASMPVAAQPVALGDQLVVAGVRQHLVDDGVIVAAVVGRAARDRDREIPRARIMLRRRTSSRSRPSRFATSSTVRSMA